MYLVQWFQEVSSLKLIITTGDGYQFQLQPGLSHMAETEKSAGILDSTTGQEVLQSTPYKAIYPVMNCLHFCGVLGSNPMALGIE